ncbi:MAG: hypothetical protein ACLQGP_17430 [Isosphaeraceae bacterium]
MQVSFVMLMALSGLGCQNKGCEASPSPQTYHGSGQYTANVYPGSMAPSGYPAYGPGGYRIGHPEDYDFHGAVRSTLWSFVIGRDPDVASAREIEETFYAGGYGASSYPGGYGR